MLENEITRKQISEDIQFPIKVPILLHSDAIFWNKINAFIPSISVTNFFLLELYVRRAGFIFPYQYSYVNEAFIHKAILRQQKQRVQRHLTGQEKTTCSRQAALGLE